MTARLGCIQAPWGLNLLLVVGPSAASGAENGTQWRPRASLCLTASLARNKVLADDFSLGR